MIILQERCMFLKLCVSITQFPELCGPRISYFRSFSFSELYLSEAPFFRSSGFLKLNGFDT